MPRNRKFRAALLAIPLVLAGCGGQSGEEAVPPEAPNQAAPEASSRAVEPPPPALAEPPPMVVSSPAYRCDDGRPLFVDVMSDESFVNMRDALEDIPTRLDRNPETGRYEGQGRSLSGTGNQVRYAAPDRPDQACRVAEE